MIMVGSRWWGVDGGAGLNMVGQYPRMSPGHHRYHHAQPPPPLSAMMLIKAFSGQLTHI